MEFDIRVRADGFKDDHDEFAEGHHSEAHLQDIEVLDVSGLKVAVFVFADHMAVKAIEDFEVLKVEFDIVIVNANTFRVEPINTELAMQHNDIVFIFLIHQIFIIEVVLFVLNENQILIKLFEVGVLAFMAVGLFEHGHSTLEAVIEVTGENRIVLILPNREVRFVIFISATSLTFEASEALPS
jgi:hypothetical protein